MDESTTQLGSGIAKVTVAGLEQFVGLRWKVVVCDHLGCASEHYEWHSWGPRPEARMAGWRCDETGDWCPMHAETPPPAPSPAD